MILGELAIDNFVLNHESSNNEENDDDDDDEDNTNESENDISKAPTARDWAKTNKK